MVKVWVRQGPKGGGVGAAHRMRLPKVWTVATVLLAGAVAAQAADIERGRELFVLCSSCHGDQGQGDQKRLAPLIGGLPSWYVAGQLRKFVAGERGYHPDDTSGLQMRPMAQAVHRDRDLEAVAAYVASLRPTPPRAAHTSGDPNRGQTLYATCVACHGIDGKGNEALKAPQLVGQSDWYLLDQLKKFRAGLRGTAPGDVTGAQMRAMMNTLPDDAAIDDVVAYIQTLAK